MKAHNHNNATPPQPPTPGVWGWVMANKLNIVLGLFIVGVAVVGVYYYAKDNSVVAPIQDASGKGSQVPANAVEASRIRQGAFSQLSPQKSTPVTKIKAVVV